MIIKAHVDGQIQEEIPIPQRTTLLILLPDQTRLLWSREDPVPGDVGNWHSKLIDASHQQRHKTAMGKEP